MPVNGIGSGSQNYGVSSTPANVGKQTYSSSDFARNIHQVQQSTYGFSRGHQRKNAADFRVETSIKSISYGIPVYRPTTTLVDTLGSGTKIKP